MLDYLINEEELDVLLNALISEHGYDFTNYAKSSLRRRVSRLMVMEKFPSFAELFYRVKTDSSFLQKFIEEITVNVSEMFRDPMVFKYIREKILPVLATHPVIRIWHAGCAHGEEVYSMAILLEEAKLLHKSLLYATDINPTVIENVKKGIFPISQMKLYSENYIAAGGKQDFSSYYTAHYNRVIFNDNLRLKMIVATHNLVTDRSFNQFQLIFCRNVLIYFNKTLQGKVLTLIDDSLENLGFLVLGTKENLRFSALSDTYMQVEKDQKIWRKM